jgi:hypothetical protein
MQNRSIAFMRMYMGPLMVLSAVYLYSEVVGVNAFIIAFLVAFGFMYSIKPFLSQFAITNNDEDISFGIENRKMFFKDRSNEAYIDLEENKLMENKKYFFLRLKNGQTLFFPKDILNKQMMDLLLGEMRGEH